MLIHEILQSIENAAGTNAKLSILQQNKDNDLLKKVLEYGLDSFKQFNIVKVPKVTLRLSIENDKDQWENFFDAADQCAERLVTGNRAVDLMWNVFQESSKENESWMRKILQKNFKIGANLKTIEKVFPGIVKTFEVQLAEKWDEKSLFSLPSKIRVEPKLDGVRLISIVKDGHCQMFSRSGKAITNFDQTLGKELLSLPDGVYDGEVMDEDFTALMRQVRRKEGADVSKSYYAIFDLIPLTEWDSRISKRALSNRRLDLEAAFKDKNFQHLRVVEHFEIDRDLASINDLHQKFVSLGFEGAMVKNPNLPYCFGRSDAVIKVKSFNDIDLEVIGFKEGTGKHEGKLGSLLVDFNGVEVSVGSGLDDFMREEIWNNKEKYLGMTAEVRYQEVTVDRYGNPNSLRFPVFVCWRNDKSSIPEFAG